MSPPKSPSLASQLLIAADTGDLAAVRRILARTAEAADAEEESDHNRVPKANPNARHSGRAGRHFNGGVTPLMLAARSGHFHICRALMQEFGADATCSDDEAWTALHYAAFSGHADICQALCDHIRLVESARSSSSNSSSNDWLSDLLQQKTQFENATPYEFARHRKFQEAALVLERAAAAAAYASDTDAVSASTAHNNQEDEKHWIWTAQEQEQALGKALQKLQRSKPKHKMAWGTFLFRYKMDLASYQRLEHLLASRSGASATDRADNRCVVLDAIDTVLSSEPSNAQEQTETKSTTTAARGRNQQPKQAVSSNSGGARVKLVVHLDFAAHCDYNHVARQRSDLEGSSLSSRVIRTSSISGMQHIIVLRDDVT